MARIDLDTYYKNFFNNDVSDLEQLREINYSHAISSKYYDVQFGRNSMLYRDRSYKLAIPIEHGLEHEIVIYFTHFLENNKCYVPVDILKSRISTILNFLKVKFSFE